MSNEKPIVWLRAEIKTPPFSREARIEAGGFLYRVDEDAIVISQVFKKTTAKTAKADKDLARKRFAQYDKDIHG